MKTGKGIPKKYGKIIAIIILAGFIQSCKGAISSYSDFRSSMDTTPPRIASVQASSYTTVEVQFSENITKSTAENSGNYFIQGSPVITITGAELSGLNTVVLTVSQGMVTGRIYQLSASGIRDEKGNTLKGQVVDYSGRGLVAAYLANTPAALTNSGDIEIDVSIDEDGDGEVEDNDAGFYKYDLDGGGWSEEISASTDIVDTDLTPAGSDETHTLSVLGKSEAGLWQDEPTVFTWRIDRKSPVSDDLALSGLPASVTTENSATITVSGTEISAYKYRITGGDWSDETAASVPISLSDLTGIPPTDYTLEVLAMDTAGNWQETAYSYTWMVNRDNPVAELTDEPAEYTSSDSIDIAVGGTEITHYQYRIDSASWSGWTAIAQRIQVDGLSEDEHTIEVLGRNSAGTEQDPLSPTSYSWTVDMTPPSKDAIILSNLPNDPTNTTTANIAVSGDDVYWYRYRLDYTYGGETDEGTWTGRYPVSDDINLTSAVLDRDGTYTLYVIGVDRALNETPYSEPLEDTTQWYSWVIDTSDPTAVLSNTPASSTASQTTDITVGGTNVVAYQYRVNSGSWSAQTAVSEHIALEDLEDGSYQVDVIALNSAGTWQSDSSPTSCSWVVDVTAPIAVLSDLPEDGVFNFTDITVEAETAESDSVVTYKYRYKIDGGSWIGGDADGWSDETDVSVHIELSDLTPDETYYLEVIGKDAVGNWQGDASVVNPSSATTHTWTVGLAGYPVAELFNKPADPTGSSATGIRVGGTGVTHYRYSIDSGAWSTDYEIADYIVETLAEGDHEIAVVGYDGANWQPEFMATEYSWSIDLTPPASVTLTMTSPDPAVPQNGSTADDDFTFSVSGTDVSHYSYRYSDGSTWTGWSADTAVATALTLTDLAGDPETEYVLEVKGRDAQGNWVDDEDIATYTWTVDKEAPAVPDVNDDGVEYNTDLYVDFYWTDDSDIAEAEIQVSTDDSFSLSGVVYEGGVTEAGHHQYVVSTEDGSQYYARIRVSDSLGNWSGWGNRSDGLDVVGSITGHVVNGLNTSEMIEAATVSLIDVNDPDDPDDDTVVATDDTLSDGSFSFTDTVPIGANRYSLLVEKTGYYSGKKDSVSVTYGAVTDCGSIYIIETSATASNITGQIVDANWGNNVEGAVVELIDYSGDEVSEFTYTTTSTGTFTMSSVDPGIYSLRVTKSGFYTFTKNNVVVDGRDGAEAQGRIAICQNLAPYQIRVTVQWGSDPRDLDLHVVGPSSHTVQETDSSYGGPTNNRFHVFYRNQKSFNETVTSGYYSSSGDSNGTSSTTSLVQDATEGYGPEAINIFKNVGDYAGGVYKFSVHNYSESNWYASDVVMRVYNEYGMVREVSFPSGAGSKYLWKAITITVAGATEVIDIDDISVVNSFASISKSFPAYDNRDKDVFDW